MEEDRGGWRRMEEDGGGEGERDRGREGERLISSSHNSTYNVPAQIIHRYTSNT